MKVINDRIARLDTCVNVLTELNKAISAEDWDTALDLQAKAIMHILDVLQGEDETHDQVWVLHHIQGLIYDRMA